MPSPIRPCVWLPGYGRQNIRVLLVHWTRPGVYLTIKASRCGLVHWRCTGLVPFAHLHGLDLVAVDNKDGLLFPEPVSAPDGRPAWALIHRPTFKTPPPKVREPRPSMWISYALLHEMAARHRVVFEQHHLLAAPQQGWEGLKIEGGSPPVRTHDGLLVLYHSVAGQIVVGVERLRRYGGGVFLLDRHGPRRVLYRSAHSVLEPQLAGEREGVVPEVVFPTGVDVRPDGVLDVYYGMADSRIGVARLRGSAVAAPAPAQAA
jgi:predicted GH43/DUF377 family glycosyl hydrolase